MDWMIENSGLSNFIIIGGAIFAAVLSLTLNLESIFVLIGLGFISFFYAYEIKLKGKKKSNLRDIPGIKIFLIAIVWGLSCCILPYIQNDVWNSQIIWPITTAFSLYILAICIPFDIRDIELDEKRKKTIPQLIGVQGSKILAILITISSYFTLIMNLDFFSIGLLIGYILTIILIALSSKEKNELFFSFIMDGLLVVMPILAYFII
jgi:4-hydroxybenzoate polyprenyltransferase